MNTEKCGTLIAVSEFPEDHQLGDDGEGEELPFQEVRTLTKGSYMAILRTDNQSEAVVLLEKSGFSMIGTFRGNGGGPLGVLVKGIVSAALPQLPVLPSISIDEYTFNRVNPDDNFANCCGAEFLFGFPKDNDLDPPSLLDDIREKNFSVTTLASDQKYAMTILLKTDWSYIGKAGDGFVFVHGMTPTRKTPAKRKSTKRTKR